MTEATEARVGVHLSAAEAKACIQALENLVVSGTLAELAQWTRDATGAIAELRISLTPGGQALTREMEPAT